MLKKNGYKISDYKKIFFDLFNHITIGINYMIPFVITGGLATALTFLFREQPGISGFMSTMSEYAMLFMWSAVAGGIAFSLAGKTGLAAGCIAGIYANEMNTAFFGGVIGGFAAGYLALWLNQRLIVKKELTVLKELLLIPLITAFITGGLLTVVIQQPIVLLNEIFTGFLHGMGTDHPLLLGLTIGFLMIIDLAGPIGKTAYFFGVATLESLTPGTVSPIMGAVMVAGMVPPLALALVLTLKPQLFSEEDQAEKAALWILGAAFITESVIPFVLRNFKAVMPGLIIGCMTAASLSIVFQCGISLPHGGLFILLIPGAVKNVLLYLVSLAAGVVSSSMLILILKGRESHEKI